MTTIIINDLSTDRRSEISLNEHDAQKVNDNWNKEDKLLSDMQGNSLFQGKLRWCDLTPTHYRYMILLSMKKYSILGTDEQTLDNDVMQSLVFFIGCLKKCIETSSECNIELIKVSFMSETQILFDFNMSSNLLLWQDPSNKKKALPAPAPLDFKIVVDNS